MSVVLRTTIVGSGDWCFDNLYSYFCQETFQDPKAIDIDSEEFKALPPEIQHELIKDIREEKTWMSKNILPGVREATILNLSV